ncbi:MAG: YfcE family phosphodiesterase [Solirubrobacterales bacterium]
MQIGIISDSHDHRINVMKAIEIFAERGIQCVLHAGDIVAPFAAKAFAKLTGVKFIAVYGNNDGEKLNLRRAIEGFGGEIHEYCYKGELANRKVYMTHTDHNVEEVVASQKYDLLVYGHTHEQDIRVVGRTMVINPGESTDWFTGSGHVVILDLKDMSHTVEPLRG